MSGWYQWRDASDGTLEANDAIGRVIGNEIASVSNTDSWVDRESDHWLTAESKHGITSDGKRVSDITGAQNGIACDGDVIGADEELIGILHDIHIQHKTNCRPNRRKWPNRHRIHI